MPLNRLTNPGRPLTSHFYGGESDTVREIPPEFRAALDLRVIEIPLPWDQEIIPLSDTVIASKAEQKVTAEWIRRTTYKQPGPVPLVERFTDKNKQFGTRTRTFRTQGDTIAFPTGTRDVKTQNLGNYHFIEDVEDVPSVFPATGSSIEEPDTTPAMFKASLPSRELKVTIPGTVTVPQILGPGEFARSETQDDEFNMTRTVKTQDPLTGYPIDLFGEKLTPEQQVETLDFRLSDTIQHLTPTATMIEGEVENLGDGRSVMRTGTVPSVFPHKTTTKELPDAVPAEFKALVPTFETKVTFTGTVTDPQILGTGEFYRSETQDTVFNLTRTTRQRDLTSLPRQIVEKRTNRYKQVETVTKILELDSTVPASPTATQDVSFNILGDGTAVEERVSVPSVFAGAVYQREIPDVAPAWAKAILPVAEQESTTTGTASDPTLSVGQLLARVQQIDVFNIRTTIRFRTIGSLPKQIVSKRTNRFKQVETVTQILELDSTVPAVPTATLDVTFTPLGDGTAVEERVSVPNVFSNVKYEARVPDNIPLEFQVAIPALTTEQTVAGTATPPTLTTGVLNASDEQVTDLTHRTSNTTRSSATGVTLIGSELTEEYGGGIVSVIKTLDSIGSLVIDSGLYVINSVVKNLGGGLGVKETHQLTTPPWPLLTESKFNEEMLSFDVLTRQVVAAGTAPTTGTNYVEQTKAIDRWRSWLIRNTVNPVATNSGIAIVSYEWKPFQFPGYVIGPYLSKYKRSTSQLCKHVIKTWWENNSTLPPVNDRYTDTLYLVNDVTGSGYERVENTLHDDVTVSFATYPATTPSASQYAGTVLVSGGGTLSFVNGSTAVVGSGTNFGGSGDCAVGDILGIYPGGGFSCAAIIDPTHLTLNAPFNFTGTGPNNWNRPTGTGWIGTEKVIAAKVTPTNIPGLWKKQTVSVVMR